MVTVQAELYVCIFLKEKQGQMAFFKNSNSSKKELPSSEKALELPSTRSMLFISSFQILCAEDG